MIKVRGASRGLFVVWVWGESRLGGRTTVGGYRHKDPFRITLFQHNYIFPIGKVLLEALPHIGCAIGSWSSGSCGY
jgi:hypothetical protein